MRFTDPLYGLLFIPAFIALWWSWRYVGGMAKTRKRVAFAIRAISAGLLIFALMGPQSVRKNSGLATVFVVDRSDSVSDADKKKEEAFVQEAVNKLGPDDVAGIVAFGTQPIIESVPGGKRTIDKIRSKTDGAGSNLAGSLRLAAATFPEGKARRIVVLSDGNETSGDSAEAVQALATDGVQVDFVALGGDENRAEASILEMDAPNTRSAEEPFDLRVLVDSSVAQSGTLVIDRDGTVVGRVPVKLSAGKNAIVVSQKLNEPGFYRYRATLEVGQDTDTRNNVGAAFTSVKGKPKVMLVQSDIGKKELANALTQQGVDVDLVNGVNFLTRPEDLQAYDSVIFNDFNADQVTERQMELVRSAVRDTGVGFMMVGGENSFLPGGWYGTPVAEVLPVDLNVRQRKSFPSTTVLIIIDTSGSMGMPEDGVIKLDLAAKAASRTAELLSANDRVGVAGSSDFLDLVAPIQKLTNKEAVIGQIKKLAPGGGGIYAEPSVQYALKLLRDDPSKVRHFILLADGADCDQHGASVGLAASMRAMHITTTAVAIGDGKDVPFLKDLATAGGGRFYLADKASKLPQIFTQDVALMARSAIEEGAFLPKMVGGSEALRGIEGTPPLLAYCISEARPLAQVGMVTQKEDPLWATWQFGLGTGAAFTSDAQNRWAKEWMGWGQFSQFWSQAVRSLNRKATLNSYDLKVTPEGGKGKVQMTVTDPSGNPVSEPNMKVNVSGANGEGTESALTQIGPGKYEGSFPAEELGTYIVSVTEPGPGGSTRVDSSGFSIPYPPEYRQTKTNTPLLTQLAETTGGKALESPEEAIRPAEKPGSSVSDLWMVFLAAAALVWPLDVAVRRLALPITEMFGLLGSLLGRKEHAVEATPAGRLVAAKRVRKSEMPAAKRPKVTPVAPVSTKSEAEAKVEESMSTSSGNAASSSSAAKRLLEAKKKRRGED